MNVCRGRRKMELIRVADEKGSFLLRSNEQSKFLTVQIQGDRVKFGLHVQM